MKDELIQCLTLSVKLTMARIRLLHADSVFRKNPCVVSSQTDLASVYGNDKLFEIFPPI